VAGSHVEVIVLKQFASCLAMPMLVIGPEGDLLFFNEPAEAILGHRFDEIGEMGRDEWTSLMVTSDDQGVPIKHEERPMIAALERRVPINKKFWLRGLDGKRRKVEGTALPLIDLGGELLGVVGIFWDFQSVGGEGAEAQVSRDGRIRYAVETVLCRRLAEALAMPVYLVDALGRLIYFNEAAGRILGRRFEDLSETTRDELYAVFAPSAEDGSPIAPDQHPMSIARERRELSHQDMWIRDLNGKSRHVEVTAIPLIGQSGRILGAFGIFWENQTA
jgi:PAS domain S-box-containing protein